MAKPKSQVNSRILVFGGVILVLGAFYAFSGDDAGPKGSGRPEARPQASTGGARQSSVKFTDEDYKADFADVIDPVQNAFNPEIRPVGTSALASLLPNEVPASFAEGETKWRYTGTVTMDQVPQVLFEHPESGDFVYLRTGASWKSAKISKITPTTVTLLGPGGMSYTLELMRDPVIDGEEDMVANMRVEPLNPLAGQIGRGGSTASQPETVASQPTEVNKSASISDTKSGDKANDAN